MIRCVKVSSGQSRPYADYVTEWKIFSDESEQHVFDFALKDLARRDMPSKEEWRKNVCYGGKEFGNMQYYFNGYYTLQKTNYGWYFAKVEPYAD